MMTPHDQAVLLEAMKRANPDIDGDLMRWIERLDPSTAAKLRAFLAQLAGPDPLNDDEEE